MSKEEVVNKIISCFKEGNMSNNSSSLLFTTINDEYVICTYGNRKLIVVISNNLCTEMYTTNGQTESIKTELSKFITNKIFN